MKLNNRQEESETRRQNREKQLMRVNHVNTQKKEKTKKRKGREHVDMGAYLWGITAH